MALRRACIWAGRGGLSPATARATAPGTESGASTPLTSGRAATRAATMAPSDASEGRDAGASRGRPRGQCQHSDRGGAATGGEVNPRDCLLAHQRTPAWMGMASFGNSGTGAGMS